MDRTKTGIKGLDELIQGGIPKGSSVLIAGGSGTCKTIFSMQYIYNGAVMFKEPGLFVTVESNAKDIMWNMESFSWDIKKLQQQKLMTIYRLRLSPEETIENQIGSELETIQSQVQELKAKRLVVDSTTALGALIKKPYNIRHTLFKFVDGLKNMDCTTVLTAETENKKTTFSAFGVEEFVADGVIALYFTPPHRSIFVRKMRGTAHDKNVHPFEIDQNGINVRSREQVLWEAIK